MKFIDEAIVSVEAGKGGNGCLSYRREKCIPFGGPNGPWGNPITAATIEAQLATFEELQDKREYEVLPSAPSFIVES